MLLIFCLPNRRSLGPGSAVEERGRKTGSNRKNIAESFPLPRLPLTPIFFSFLPQCRACFQAAMKATVEASRERTPSGRRIPSGREKGVCNWSWSFQEMSKYRVCMEI